MSVAKFSSRKLKQEICQEARVIGIQPGAAEMIAEKVCEEVGVWIKKRSMVTNADLTTQVAKSLKKYNKDLAYIFRNREKLI